MFCRDALLAYSSSSLADLLFPAATTGAWTPGGASPSRKSSLCYAPTAFTRLSPTPQSPCFSSVETPTRSPAGRLAERPSVHGTPSCAGTLPTPNPRLPSRSPPRLRRPQQRRSLSRNLCRSPRRNSRLSMLAITRNRTLRPRSLPPRSKNRLSTRTYGKGV